MPAKRRIVVHLMGGTIDSRNDPSLDGAITVMSKSLVKRFLTSLETSLEWSFDNICMKDSRSITQGDRNVLLQSIAESTTAHHLITHGTYTIHDTAAFLAGQELLKGKVVVLTGGMGTLLGSIDEEGHLMPSDAQFNLGYAIAELFHIESGVYICMSGETFRYPHETWMHTTNGIHQQK